MLPLIIVIPEILTELVNEQVSSLDSIYISHYDISIKVISHRDIGGLK